MFGIGKKKKEQQKSESGGSTAFVWRSFKKLIVTVLLIGTLAFNTFVLNLDLVWKGTLSLQDALVNSYVSALAKGFSNFIPKMIGFFVNIFNNQPAQAFVLNFIPDFIVFSAVFLWISIVADILDMRKDEAVAFHWVLIFTFVLLAVFSLSAMGYTAVMSMMNGGG